MFPQSRRRPARLPSILARPQSDRESMEHLLKGRIEKRLARTTDEIERVLKEEWEALDAELLTSLAHSMPTRCAAVVANHVIKRLIDSIQGTSVHGCAAAAGHALTLSAPRAAPGAADTRLPAAVRALLFA